MRVIASCLLVLALALPAHSATIHVPADYTTIHEALEVAVSGDSVLVGPGTYTATVSRLFHFVGPPSETVTLTTIGFLPAGVTRFRVSERVLGVRYPLERMMSGEPKARNVELRRFVAERWAENRVRQYREPVVLFE